MKRYQRILCHVLLPAPMATTILFVPYFWRNPIEVFVAVFVYSLPAYLLAGIPSLLYAWLMERAYARGLVPGCLGAGMLSSALGGLSGVAIVGVPALASHGSLIGTEVGPMAAVGAATGAAIELFMRFLDRRSRARSRPVTSTASISDP